MSDNGNTPQLPDDVEARQAIHAYPGLQSHLGAVIVILRSMPLQAMLDANRIMRPRVLLTLPAGTSRQQAAAVGKTLDDDERMIHAALALVRTAEAIEEGR